MPRGSSPPPQAARPGGHGRVTGRIESPYSPAAQRLHTAMTEGGDSARRAPSGFARPVEVRTPARTLRPRPRTLPPRARAVRARADPARPRADPADSRADPKKTRADLFNSRADATKTRADLTKPRADRFHSRAAAANSRAERADSRADAPFARADRPDFRGLGAVLPGGLARVAGAAVLWGVGGLTATTCGVLTRWSLPHRLRSGIGGIPEEGSPPSFFTRRCLFYAPGGISVV
jgi:hypothetical protein